MVTRYKQTGYDRGLEPAHDGSLVSFSDFTRLEAENRDLRAKLETVEVVIDFVARWAWRTDPPNANHKLSDAEDGKVVDIIDLRAKEQEKRDA